ncbi:MAG: hypothetical protein F6Q13_14440 [Mycobacterium sp.]|nr:MAG: hypothetical protein F6Q13_14440 [Mycobacterium sp.]
MRSVRPVVDYEPPLRDVRQCRSQWTAAPRRSTPHPPTPRPSRRTGMSAPMRQAAMFADAALRRVLEVLDRRRPAAQLQGLLATGLVDSVLAANRVVSCRLAADGGAAAVLRRVRVREVSRPDRLAAEVFGTYSRGGRVHAIACRIEQATEGRWQVVALHIG